ncbi:hypothetical protein P3T39_007390 [Kitasatospora sp. GP82]|nr:hypothetical protein [Kitasatospora sp. GP82]
MRVCRLLVTTALTPRSRPVQRGGRVRAEVRRDGVEPRDLPGGQKLPLDACHHHKTHPAGRQTEARI